MHTARYFAISAHNFVIGFDVLFPLLFSLLLNFGVLGLLERADMLFI